MEPQPVPLKSLAQHGQHPLAVPVVLEEHHSVVGVSHQQAAPPQAWSHRLDEPLVQHVVQERVRDEGLDHTALRGALPGPLQDALFEHPGLEPLVQHLPDYSILDPQVEELPQVRVRNRAELFRDVRVKHPPLPSHHACPHCVQGIMGRAARAEPVRARQEICLVHRFQQHHDRSLRHLVLERGDAKGPRRAVRFRDVVPPDRRRDVAARLDPSQ